MHQPDNSDLLYQMFMTRPYKATGSYVIKQSFKSSYPKKDSSMFRPDGLPKQVGTKNVKS
jgi:hypothetical protein